ncbi:MAG: hypothetical protein IJ680_03245 [Paludibacteraceae bacterium]|nr:hypothetical protein [Paludibacteraceae bacterium]
MKFAWHILYVFLFFCLCNYQAKAQEVLIGSNPPALGELETSADSAQVKLVEESHAYQSAKADSTVDGWLLADSIRSNRQHGLSAEEKRALLFGESNIVQDTTVVLPVQKLTREQRRLRRDSMRLNWQPDPAKATWLAVVVPGLGQIYNKKYWKLPIVYGGFLGCAYAISWNGTMYRDYKQAYRDIIDDDPSTTSYLDILPQGYTIEMMGGLQTYASTLKSRQQRYHRYRDIGIVATVLVYALSVIDAFVDAQLYDFDISPDLSMSVMPSVYQDHYYHNQRTAGLQFTFRF